jgi:hypothetical protein
MNIHPDSKDSLSLNLLIGGNSPDAKSLAVLAELDISASIIASAPLPRSRWYNARSRASLTLERSKTDAEIRPKSFAIAPSVR